MEFDEDVPPDSRVRVVAGGLDDRDDERLRLSDVGGLARRYRRRVSGAARAADRLTFAAIISEHLGVPLAGTEVVEDESRLDSVIARTEGVTASFLKELLRRSALVAASDSGAGPLAVSADQLDTALDELLDTRNAMTRVLLGGGRE